MCRAYPRSKASDTRVTKRTNPLKGMPYITNCGFDHEFRNDKMCKGTVTIQSQLCLLGAYEASHNYRGLSLRRAWRTTYVQATICPTILRQVWAIVKGKAWMCLMRSNMLRNKGSGRKAVAGVESRTALKNSEIELVIASIC